MDVGDRYTAESQANASALVDADRWTDGDLDNWWKTGLCDNPLEPYNLLPWWMRSAWRDGISGHPMHVPSRAWNNQWFFVAYPGLAPYYPFANPGYPTYDPWLSQPYYTTWW